MPVQLKPSQLFDLLYHAFELDEPVIIVGKPGVGKTAIVEQAAVKYEAELIKMHPALDEPTDVKGIPWFFEDAKGKKRAAFVPIGQFERVMTAKGKTILFLDDFLQAVDAVQKGHMQTLHGREIAGHRIPDCVRMVIATNDRSHRAGAGGALEPIKSRTTIVELVEDLDEWARYWLFEQQTLDGVKVSMDLLAETVAFLKARPELFCDFNPNVDLKNSPNPRTWVKSIKWLTRPVDDVVQLAAQTGVLGEGPAGERLAFRETYRQMPTIDAILLNPDAVEIPEQPSILFAICGALAGKANEKNFERVARFADRMREEARGDMASMMIRTATRRDPSLQQTPAFVKLMTGELGKIIAGTV